MIFQAAGLELVSHAPGRLLANNLITEQNTFGQSIEIDGPSGAALRTMEHTWSLCKVRGGTILVSTKRLMWLPDLASRDEAPRTIFEYPQDSFPELGAPCGRHDDLIITAMKKSGADAERRYITLMAFDLKTGERRWSLDLAGFTTMTRRPHEEVSLPAHLPVITTSSTGEELSATTHHISIVRLRDGALIAEHKGDSLTQLLLTTQSAHIIDRRSQQITAFQMGDGALGPTEHLKGRSHDLVPARYRFGQLWLFESKPDRLERLRWHVYDLHQSRYTHTRELQP
jgi:hypothetical protein